MNGPPSTLGQYQIIREIARSNDIVYEAYDPLMNRRVAIKELAVPQGSTPQQREERINRFKREAQAAGTLNDPHIMTVFSFAEDSGRTFMAMEYLDGSTLRNEIDTKGFVPIDRAVEIASQVLEGLAHAHSKGVIHRDIKPDNIQILSTGQIKITDFGIARLTFQPNLTMDGQVFGTPSYMSPEQVVGKEIDARSDLFSVAVVLFEMISGQKPFPGDSVVSITYAIMNTEPAKPQQCPQALWEVVRKGLDKSPMMRFSSAAEFEQALKNAMHAPAPPPISIPYAPPMGQTQAALPPAYAFNPYQNQSAPIPGMPPVQQYPQNPFAQANLLQYLPPGTMPPPMYYPPPPRMPIFKPETLDFFKKLVVALIVFGTMFLLIIVGLSQISKAYNTYRSDQGDANVLKSVDLDPRIPLDERIAKLEHLRSSVTGGRSIEAIDKELGVLIGTKGQQALRSGDLGGAEALFKEAIDHDGTNPALFSNLASLYDQRAQLENDPSTRLSLWHDAGQNWEGAYQSEPNVDTRSKYGVGAAESYYMYAQSLSSYDLPGNRNQIRDSLYHAMRVIDPRSQPDLYSKINQLMDQVR
jgi:serine/threonine protein kinase